MTFHLATAARTQPQIGCPRLTRRATVRCSLHGHFLGVRASRVSGPEEDREVAHFAFMHAFQASAPEAARIPGMQEFAGAVSGQTGQRAACRLGRVASAGVGKRLRCAACHRQALTTPSLPHVLQLLARQRIPSQQYT